MRYWIYKTNPEKYHIEARLRDPREEITWMVSRYADLTSAGDIAFIWVTGDQRGIVGAIQLTSAPMLMEEITAELPYCVEPSTNAATRVNAVITHRGPYLPAMKLRNMPELMKCAVFHGFQQATNFILTEKEAHIFLDLLEGRRSLP